MWLADFLSAFIYNTHHTWAKGLNQLKSIYSVSRALPQHSKTCSEKLPLHRKPISQMMYKHHRT